MRGKTSFKCQAKCVECLKQTLLLTFINLYKLFSPKTFVRLKLNCNWWVYKVFIIKAVFIFCLFLSRFSDFVHSVQFLLVFSKDLKCFLHWIISRLKPDRCFNCHTAVLWLVMWSRVLVIFPVWRLCYSGNQIIRFFKKTLYIIYITLFNNVNNKYKLHSLLVLIAALKIRKLKINNKYIHLRENIINLKREPSSLPGKTVQNGF